MSSEVKGRRSGGPGKRKAVGSVVNFFDGKGRYISGVIIDEETFRVLKSNVVAKGSLMCKSPYWSWARALARGVKGTRLSPKDLVAFTKLFGDGDVASDSRDEPGPGRWDMLEELEREEERRRPPRPDEE